MLAPAEGTVSFMMDGRPDQQIGSTDGRYQSGNNIVLDIGGGHFLMMGHLSVGLTRGGTESQKVPADPRRGDPGTPAGLMHLNTRFE